MSHSQKFTQVVREWSEVFMRRSMRDFFRFTKDTGLSNPQISTLMRLHYQGACGVSDIGAHLDVTNAAASQMIEKLVQSGLLERAEDHKDRRAKQITLSAKGRKLIEQSIEARRRWLEELTDAFTAAQQEAIIDALTHLTAAARESESTKDTKVH